MKLALENAVHGPKRRCGAFSLVEILVAFGAIAIIFVSLYAGFTQGFAVIQLARENLRATQILQEKMETIRLYRWEQVTDPNFIPSTFSAPFYAVGTNDAGGLTYQGTLTVSAVSMPEAAYESNMRMVIADVRWSSGGTTRFRQMRTLVTRYGLQQYIY